MWWQKTPIDIQQTSCLRRTTSNESVFCTSTSFAEEVADALIKRAGSLRDSHRSVIIGREERLIKGLQHLAEEVRGPGLQKTSDEPICLIPAPDLPPGPFSLVRRHIQTKSNGDGSKPATIPDILERKRDPALFTQTMSSDGNGMLKLMKSASGSSNVTESSDTALNQEDVHVPTTIRRENYFIEFRRAFDISGAGDSNTWNEPLRTDKSLSTSKNGPSLDKDDTASKRRIRRRCTRREQRESGIKFLRCISKGKKASNSEDEYSLGTRSLTFERKKRLTSLRKRIHDACSGYMKRAEERFSRLKLNIVNTFKN